jgi:hypothetical protein
MKYQSVEEASYIWKTTIKDGKEKFVKKQSQKQPQQHQQKQQKQQRKQNRPRKSRGG